MVWRESWQGQACVYALARWQYHLNRDSARLTECAALDCDPNQPVEV